MTTNLFNTPINREGTSCVKYDMRDKVFGSNSVIPMWVADMDIATPSFILDAIRDRLSHPVLGYGFRNDAYHSAIVHWLKSRHEWTINSQWITFCPGVVSGLNHAISALTNPTDSIIIQPPVYHPFFHTVENNGRRLITNPLVEKDGHYTMDFSNLERHLKNGATMLILSNPHNPVGRVWSMYELTTLGNLCAKYNTIIISDEIHSDLIFTPHKHIPLASVSDTIADITITFSSPSKTFNIAGLATAFAVISNRELRGKYNRELEKTGSGMGNILGPIAVEAAYTNQGEAWLNKLLAHLKNNEQMVKQFLHTKLPQIGLSPLEGTYLLWLDFRKFKLSDKDLNHILISNAGIGLNHGSTFGKEGEGFQRMNIACPQETIVVALEKLEAAFSTLY